MDMPPGPLSEEDKEFEEMEARFRQLSDPNRRRTLGRLSLMFAPAEEEVEKGSSH